MTVRFVHATPHGNAGRELEALLKKGTESAQLAFCYFRGGGRAALQRHVRLLTRPDSFVVVSCDRATDLDEVAELHDLLPGNVYIHLGWATPEEKGGGSALMHSKVCLVRGANDYKGLWVGSHNLTASALTGANLEAALVYESKANEPAFADAEAHLAHCRDTAERFDPERLEFYRSLQNSRPEPIGIRESVLCIHAEEVASMKKLPAVVHIRLQTTDFDEITRTDTPVHFFVHPPGTLGKGQLLHTATRLYTGKVIEENRTELHPGGGSASVLPKATHWLELQHVPKLIAVNSSTLAPMSQAAIKLDKEEVEPQQFLYSVRRQRIQSESVAVDGEGHVGGAELPTEMQHFFTMDSLADSRLYFTPRQQLVERSCVNVFEGTPIPNAFHVPNEQGVIAESMRRREAPQRSRRAVKLDVVRRAPRLSIESYFFLSRFRVRTDDESLE